MKRTINHFLQYICFGIIFSIVLCINPSYAQQDKNSDAGYIFYKANTLYEKGSYDEAISEYSRLLEQGMESGNLHYNLGNCYFKKGELGKALLSYERAKRLIPRDSDLKANYTFAKSQIKANTPETSASWREKASGIFSFLSVNEMTLLVSALFVITIVFLIARLFVAFSKNTFFLLITSLVILFVFTAFSLVDRIAVRDTEAIVVADSAEARFEPFESSTKHFTLQEGMKVYLIQLKTEWVKVKRSDGKTGWVKTETIELI